MIPDRVNFGVFDTLFSGTLIAVACGPDVRSLRNWLRTPCDGSGFRSIIDPNQAAGVSVGRSKSNDGNGGLGWVQKGGGYYAISTSPHRESEVLNVAIRLTARKVG